MNEHKTISVLRDLKIEQLVKEIIRCEEKQVILEVPADSSVLTNEINLRLIKFYAEEEEKDIIISANDPVLIALAQRLGISTIRERELIPGEDEDENDFSSAPANIPKESHSKRKGNQQRDNQPLQRRTSPNIGSLIPAILVAFFSFVLAFWWFMQPKVKVTVYPKEQFLNFRTEANLTVSANDSDITQGKVAGKIFEKVYQIEVQTMASGSKVVGVTPASGIVTVVNSTTQPVVLPKGTVFIGRSGVRFLSQKEVLVPKRATKYQHGIPTGEEYGRADVAVIAEIKGTKGNQPAKSITQVEGKYQRVLKVINLKPTSNGVDKTVPVVTLEDVKKGEAEAKRQMALAGREEAITLVGKDYIFLPELVNLELISVKNQPDIGEETTTLLTHLEYKATVLTPSRSDIHKYLLIQLDKNIPPNFMAKNNEVKLISTKATVNSANQIQLEILGQGTIKGVLHQATIKELIKGKTLTEAKNILAKQNAIANFEIDIPNQGGKLPRFGFQIKVLLPSELKGQ